jgi:asparagine synthase (glutamine-hydrolysing)
VEEMLAESALREAGMFDVAGVRALWRKCRGNANAGQLSNSDNMALVGVLSTQLLYHQLVRRRPDPGPKLPFTTMVEA